MHGDIEFAGLRRLFEEAFKSHIRTKFAHYMQFVEIACRTIKEFKSSHGTLTAVPKLS